MLCKYRYLNFSFVRICNSIIYESLFFFKVSCRLLNDLKFIADSSRLNQY